MKLSINDVWRRITSHEGDSFYTKTGKEFSYEVVGNAVIPSRTKYNLGKAEFEKVLPHVPCDGPGVIRDIVRGPAYIWAILHDRRIRKDEW